jgi:hypothetical protein
MLQHQQMSAFQTPQGPEDINFHVGQMYTPGYDRHVPSHSPHASITVTPAGEMSGFDAFNGAGPFTIPCKDFLQRGRATIAVECDFDTCGEVTKLVEQVNNGNLIVQPAKEFGLGTGLSALQNGLNAVFPHHFPPSDSQLETLLRTTGSSVDFLDHGILATLLEKYGDQDGRQLQLGILDESQQNLYKAMIYSSRFGYTMNASCTTIWLFYSPPEPETGFEGYWSAFVPPKFHPRRRISYAEAASTVLKPSTPNPRPSQYLELPPSSPAGRPRNASPIRRGPRAPRQIRPRQGGPVSLPNRRPGTPLQNTAESFTKYGCKNCSKTFETQSELM